MSAARRIRAAWKVLRGQWVAGPQSIQTTTWTGPPGVTITWPA